MNWLDILLLLLAAVWLGLALLRIRKSRGCNGCCENCCRSCSKKK